MHTNASKAQKRKRDKNSTRSAQAKLKRHKAAFEMVHVVAKNDSFCSAHRGTSTNFEQIDDIPEVKGKDIWKDATVADGDVVSRYIDIVSANPHYTAVHPASVTCTSCIAILFPAMRTDGTPDVSDVVAW